MHPHVLFIYETSVGSYASKGSGNTLQLTMDFQALMNEMENIKLFFTE